jgi:hypothetical protein
MPWPSIHLAEDELRNGEALFSGAVNPLRRLSVVLWHDLAELVHDAQKILREAAAFVSVFTKTMQLFARRIVGSLMRTFDCSSAVGWHQTISYYSGDSVRRRFSNAGIRSHTYTGSWASA